MKKIYKPFEGHPDYQCFGCSPSNPIGLNLHFYEDDEYVMADWETKSEYQGFVNVLHGGIQSTLIDEIAAWCVSIKIGTSGVTQELNVKYLKSVRTDGQTIKLRAKLINMVKNIAYIEAELINANGDVCAKGELKYFTYPEPIAKKRLLYPGKEAFYKPSVYLKK